MSHRQEVAVAKNWTLIALINTDKKMAKIYISGICEICVKKKNRKKAGKMVPHHYNGRNYEIYTD
jgi:hypothetical protein